MVWNIAPECVSIVVLSIIWIYSRKGYVTPSLKNRLFQVCFLTTFLAMFSNIVSTILIYDLQPYTIYTAWFTNMLYFIATPLMGMVYFLYAVAILYEYRHFTAKWIYLVLVPAFFYIILVLINPWTHWIYSLSVENGYGHGPLIFSTYLIFFLYCICCVILVIWKGRYVDKTVRAILFTFPIIAAIVILVQLVYPEVILSGSAATIALLMIYLYMQNKQISIDYLTKLANRQEFLNMIEIEMEQYQQPFTLIIVSLRDFKRINDSFGQHIGDHFLIAISEYLKQELQLGERSLYRYGGDEFAILNEGNDAESVRKMVETIKARMLQLWEVDGYTSLLGVALGIVEYPTSADTKEQLINGIEFSVHKAKSDATHDHVCYCTKEILEHVHRRQQIMYILRSCLAERSFEVYYQPIYDVKRKCFTRAEALLRIPKSALGPIYPDEFIPIAEESGLIIDITYLVLDEVCHMIQKFNEQHVSFEEINVNFSTIQFMQPDMIERVIAILKEHNVKGSQIKIEITESTLSENATTMMDYVKQMKSYGISLGLDDFGTGYSNAASVIAFPIETVKLDKSLVWAAMESDHSAIFVRSIVEVFRNLGYSVLAEGVETKEQSDFVEDCGCSQIQGYLYARPMPKEAYLQFMKEQTMEQEGIS